MLELLVPGRHIDHLGRAVAIYNHKHKHRHKASSLKNTVPERDHRAMPESRNNRVRDHEQWSDCFVNFGQTLVNSHRISPGHSAFGGGGPRVSKTKVPSSF